MSAGNAKGPFEGGRHKDGRPYKEGNTNLDGSYRVGKNKPPKGGQFRKNDGRQRGQRSKGAVNHDTFYEKELRRKVTVREDGQERKVTKGQGVDLRLISNASRGDVRAIAMVDERRRRLAAEKEETARRYHRLNDNQILHQYPQELSDDHGIDPDLFGDPDPDPEKEIEGGSDE